MNITPAEQPHTTLTPIHIDAVPDIALREMIDRSTFLTAAPALSPFGFTNVFKVEHEQGETYIAGHPKTYFNDEKEYNSYVVDIEGNVVKGFGEIRYAHPSTNPYFSNKPFVGWTNTIPGFERQGLGRRRLITMNMATLAMFGRKLHSDTVMAHPGVHKMWDRLVEDNLAMKFIEPVSDPTQEGHPRYRFL